MNERDVEWEAGGGQGDPEKLPAEGGDRTAFVRCAQYLPGGPGSVQASRLPAELTSLLISIR